MKFIKLSHGYMAMVDDADYERLAKLTWRARPTGFMVYAARRERTEDGRSKIRYLHHAVLEFPPTRGLVVDHKDGNPLNCCRDNLRVCTHSQNSMNHRPLSGKRKSKYKGVTYDQRGKRVVWKASICKEGKRYHLGCFPDEYSAVKVYNVWAMRLHGRFAYLNHWEGPTAAESGECVLSGFGEDREKG